jgi:hypothetical protein
MNRYDIALGKPPPPPRPRPEKKFDQSIVVNPLETRASESLLDQIFGDMRVQTTVAPSLIPQEQRASIVEQYMATPDGRARLAASMANPLRERINYRSIARRILQVDILEDGILPFYDLNREGTFVISANGQDVTCLSTEANRARPPRRIVAPLFEIGSNPEIPMTQIQQRRYELIDRAQNLAVAEISRTEDANALRLLDVVAVGCNRNITAREYNTPQDIEATFRRAFESINTDINAMAGRRIGVARVFMNAINYTPIRRLGFISRNEERAELIGSGNIGSMWGAQIIVSRVIPAGHIYLTAEPQFVGAMPVRTDIIVLSADNPVNHTIGWSIFEQIGMLCNNPFAIAKITLE